MMRWRDRAGTSTALDRVRRRRRSARSAVVASVGSASASVVVVVDSVVSAVLGVGVEVLGVDRGQRRQDGPAEDGDRDRRRRRRSG